jgi:hypothetical protein
MVSRKKLYRNGLVVQTVFFLDNVSLKNHGPLGQIGISRIYVEVYVAHDLAHNLAHDFPARSWAKVVTVIVSGAPAFPRLITRVGVGV